MVSESSFPEGAVTLSAQGHADPAAHLETLTPDEVQALVGTLLGG